MARCDRCGNDFGRSFTVSMGGETYTFDSFECAALRLAPVCAQCSVRIPGHGLEENGATDCRAHYASGSAQTTLVDRA